VFVPEVIVMLVAHAPPSSAVTVIPKKSRLLIGALPAS
jgi:hypothetical protein